MLEIINSKNHTIKVPAPKYQGVIELKPYELKSFEDEGLMKFYEPYKAIGLVVRLNGEVKDFTNYGNSSSDDESETEVRNESDMNESLVNDIKDFDDNISDEKLGLDNEDGNSENEETSELPEYYSYSWKDLTKYAKSLGINTYGLDKEAILKKLDSIEK